MRLKRDFCCVKLRVVFDVGFVSRLIRENDAMKCATNRFCSCNANLRESAAEVFSQSDFENEGVL